MAESVPGLRSKSPPPPSFEAVHREFRPKVLRYIAGFVPSDEAADLTQITMIKVSEHLAEFRGESSLASWIYRIATNVAVDRLRQRTPQRVALGGEADDDDEAVDENGHAELQAPSVEKTAIRQETSACVREFVDRLPANYRTILVLSDIEGFANDEIAAITGLSLDTVKIRLHRARLKLREALSNGCTIRRDDRNGVDCDRRPLLRLK
jgi:RNA polymerase sigma-70 factor (ECF subfamily)